MERDLDVESISLWGVLHDGEVRQIADDSAYRSLTLGIEVAYLSGYYNWPSGALIQFQFSGVRSTKVNQWIPQPGLGNEDLGSRRWTPREWPELVNVIPPRSILISEAAVTPQGSRLAEMTLAGHEQNGSGKTNIWLELKVEAEELRIRTPEGSVDLDRLIQLGDAYWDDLGKKRKR